MIEFKLTFCPQCGGKLATGPVPPTMLCSPCHLTFTEGTPSPRNTNWPTDLTVLFIAPPRTMADGTVIPAGVAVEAGVLGGLEERMANESYTIVGDKVIVTCPKGHKNWGQKVSDKLGTKTLVCANVKCKAEWTETLPRINGLEEVT